MKILVAENKRRFYKGRVIHFIFPLYKISGKENPTSLMLDVVVMGNKRRNYRRILYRDQQIPHQTLPLLSDGIMRNVKEKMAFGEEDIKVIGKRISALAEKAIKRELGI